MKLSVLCKVVRHARTHLPARVFKTIEEIE